MSDVNKDLQRGIQPFSRSDHSIIIDAEREIPVDTIECHLPNWIERTLDPAKRNFYNQHRNILGEAALDIFKSEVREIVHGRQMLHQTNMYRMEIACKLRMTEILREAKDIDRASIYRHVEFCIRQFEEHTNVVRSIASPRMAKKVLARAEAELDTALDEIYVKFMSAA
jgi:hypothetical protein